jgi:shikimate kinase
MGSGKSTIGKILAEQNRLQFIDLDTFIEEAEGQKVSKIFQTKGELYFRKKEFQYLVEVLAFKKGFVLATGGGTPCYGKNLQSILEASSNVIYLKVSLNGLIERLSAEKEHRPLIRDISNDNLTEFIGKHLFERSFFYIRRIV